MKTIRLLLLLSTLCLACASAEPSSREKEILAKAKPGVPVTLPDRKSDVVMKSPFPTAGPDITQRNRQVTPKRKSAKSNTLRVPTRTLKIQAFWIGGGEGKPRVVINRDKQFAQVWAGDQLVGQSPVATGRAGFETPTGKYTISQKERDYHSNQYGSWVDANGRYKGDADAGDKAPSGLTYAPAPMPFFMRLTDGGIGMHAGYVPGVPASHGCIRLPHNMAEHFFDYLPMGTSVEILD
ncbi:MAG: L,D-transpeptidase family protein [Candidatus Methylacidiphilales bacterium]|nr:L,D-transpeptidase family protein [Candidatus Methylacidiphilales bacterium]